MKQLSNQNCRKLMISIALALVASSRASGDTVQLGSYSGQPGYFVRIGKGAQDILNAVIMTPEAYKQLQKLKPKVDINQLRTCEVEGMQQTIGYTIFAIKSCK